MLTKVKHYLIGDFLPAKGDIPSLYGLRALALAMLFYVHGYMFIGDTLIDKSDYFRNFMHNGSACIDLFFVLSGFLISGALFRELNRTNDISFKRFFLRRTLRIFPPYYIFLAYTHFVFLPKFTKKGLSSPDPAIVAMAERMQSQWIYSFSYLSNYFPDALMIHSWSLSLEEQFYIFLPIFLVLVYRRINPNKRLFLLIGLCLVPVLFRLHALYFLVAPAADTRHAYEKYIYHPFHTHADSIFIGVLAGYIFVHHREWIDRLNQNATLHRALTAGVFLFLATFGVLVYEFKPGLLSQVFRFTLISSCWALLIFLSLRTDSLLNRVLSLRIFYPLAKLSYSTYIIHPAIMFPITLWIKKTMGPLDYWEFFQAYLLFFSICTFLGYFYYLVAERPFALMKDLIPKGPQVAATARAT